MLPKGLVIPILQRRCFRERVVIATLSKVPTSFAMANLFWKKLRNCEVFFQALMTRPGPQQFENDISVKRLFAGVSKVSQLRTYTHRLLLPRIMANLHVHQGSQPLWPQKTSGDVFEHAFPKKHGPSSGAQSQTSVLRQLSLRPFLQTAFSTSFGQKTSQF